MKYVSLIVLICFSAHAFHAVANEPAAGSSILAPVPHCQVPCGIYADQMRFEMMLEDTATIAKAIDNVIEISDSLSTEPTPTAINQVTRWVQTKEDHATNTQMIIAEYFLAQRIKSDKENYPKQLAAAHAVIVNAMKCKQDAAPATAKALKESIFELYRAYEGKEPKFHEEKK